MCVQKCAKFSPSQALFTRCFSILQIPHMSSCRIILQPIKVNESILGHFMLDLGVVLGCFSKYLGGSR